MYRTSGRTSRWTPLRIHLQTPFRTNFTNTFCEYLTTTQQLRGCATSSVRKRVSTLGKAFGKVVVKVIVNVIRRPAGSACQIDQIYNKLQNLQKLQNVENIQHMNYGNYTNKKKNKFDFW